MNKVESATAKRLAPRNENQGGKEPSAEQCAALSGKNLVPRREGDRAVTPALPSEAECAALSVYFAKGEAKVPAIPGAA